MWCYFKGLLVGGLTTSLGLVLVAVSAPGASATSCAAHPDGSPGAIAAEREVLSLEQPFRERYDGAVMGTVLQVRTQSDGDRADYGRTEVVMDVLGGLGPILPERVVIIEPDPGWVNGFGLQPGQHYFVPYVVEDGDLKSHLCDPISIVDPSAVAEFVAIAEEHPWPEGHLKALPPEAARVGGHSAVPLDDPAQGSRWPALAVGAAGLVAVAGLARLAWRSRGRSD